MGQKNKPPFRINPRMYDTKWKVFHERAAPNGKTYCELCHKAEATDLHEIINRVHYRPDQINEVPKELLACLCNRCNTTVADGKKQRRQLLEQNVDRYGLSAVKQAVIEFAAKARGFRPDIKLPSLFE